MTGFSRLRSGIQSMTIPTMSQAVLAMLAVVLLLTFTTGPGQAAIDQVADALFGIGYEQSAVNSAKAMTYALSCTALTHSYQECDQSYPDDSWQAVACHDMKQNWDTNAAPRAAAQGNIRTIGCKASVKQPVTFGQATVSCTPLDETDGGCTINGFTLPQEFGTDPIASAKQFLIGYGAPKYLLYYEAYDPAYTKEWEHRLESTSYLVLASQAVGSGLLAAIFAGGTVAAAKSPASGSMIRQAVKRSPLPFSSMTSTLVAGIGRLRNTLPTSVINRRITVGGEERTVRELLDQIAATLRLKLESIRVGLFSLNDILFWSARSADDVEQLQYQLLLRHSLLETTGIVDGGAGREALGEITETFWTGTSRQAGLRELFEEGVDATDGRTIRELLEEGDDETARDIIQQRMRNLNGELDSPLPTTPLDDAADEVVTTARLALDGEDFAAAAGMGRRMYWTLTAHQSNKAQEVLELLDAGDEEAAERLLRGMVDDGDDVLRNLDPAERAAILGRTESTLCGSRPSVRMAAYIATAGIAQEVTSREDVKERWLATTAPAAVEAGHGITQAVRSACRNGNSPTNAIIKAEGGGFLVAAATAAVLVNNARELRMNLIKQPQGVNTLVLTRPDISVAPKRYPLNKYANWWYMALDPQGEIGPGPAEIDPPQRRLMLASPCYPRPKNEDKPASISVARVPISAMLTPGKTGLGNPSGLKKEGAGGSNSCRWEPNPQSVSFCGGKIRTCRPLSHSTCTQVNGCTWSSDAGECRLASDKTYPLQCSNAVAMDSSLCSQPGLSASTSGRNRLQVQTWYTSVQGSYYHEVPGVTGPEHWIMYTRYPIVHPTPNSSMQPWPPGMNSDLGEDPVSTVTLKGATDEVYQDEAQDTPYYDQRGWWSTSGGNTEPQIPRRYVTATGNGIKTMTPVSLMTIFEDINVVSKEKKYDLQAVRVRFENTDAGKTGDGPNYCHARKDWDATAAKATIFGGAIATEVLLDALDIVSLGTSYAATAFVEFGIGTTEYLLSWWVEEEVAAKWPY